VKASLYLDRRSPIHRLDPRGKLLAFFLLVAAIVGTQALWALAVSLGIASFAALLGRALPAVWRFRALIVLLAVAAILIWALTAQGDHKLWWRVSTDSLAVGLAAAIKLDTMVIAAVVLLATTRIEELSLAMAKLWIPYKIGFVFTFALGLLPQILGIADSVMLAQRGRGVDPASGNLLKRTRHYVPLLVPIFLVTIRNVNDQAIALEAKGFGAVRRRTSYLDCRFRAADLVVTAAAAAWCVFCIGYI
jgi:energy-coupling factor transport system permease protein